MTEKWLIDGYNLLHAIPALFSGRTRTTREDLLARLAGFAAASSIHLTVVLDGKGNSSVLDSYRTVLFDVVYSQNVSADAVIEKTLYLPGAELHRWVVVTNDHEIGNIARGKGASVMRCEECLARLKSSEQESAAAKISHQDRAHRFNRPFDEKLKDL